MSNGIKVRATRTGWYDLALREPGDTFFIKRKEDFSAAWMEETDKPKADAKPQAPAK
jgi:hypothetical protein